VGSFVLLAQFLHAVKIHRMSFRCRWTPIAVQPLRTQSTHLRTRTLDALVTHGAPSALSVRVSVIARPLRWRRWLRTSQFVAAATARPSPSHRRRRRLHRRLLPRWRRTLLLVMTSSSSGGAPRVRCAPAVRRRRRQAPSTAARQGTSLSRLPRRQPLLPSRPNGSGRSSRLQSHRGLCRQRRSRSRLSPVRLRLRPPLVGARRPRPVCQIR
jgi:hypothetical protein